MTSSLAYVTILMLDALCGLLHNIVCGLRFHYITLCGISVGSEWATANFCIT